ADVLRGANSKKIKNAKLDEVKEYGKLKTIEREDLITIIEWLIDRHYILKTKHSLYPVLHPTYDGLHYGESLTTRKLQGLLKILENR
ncbi:RQC domain-containing protein, partial [uncultured Traorella sp.]|uniref:RQC domain-containing protein n=1 Tax=uncultured Traorella sp. TaxID=1929048 RepID=UPI0025E360A5